MIHHRSPMAPSEVAAVRLFYTEVLGGRQVWPTRHTNAAGRLWFLVGATLLEASADDVDAPPPVVLTVDAPDQVAERCWDAGFLVHVHDDATGRAPVSVVDPLGRRIDLAPRVPTTGAHRSSDREER